MILKLLTFLALILTLATECSATKPYRMRILNMYLGAVGKACKAISQLVVDIVNNNRSDILADYHIDMDFEDEADGGFNSYKPPKLVIQYQRNFPAGYYQSPIVIGPFVSAGCKAYGTFLHHLNVVGISTGCSAQILLDRNHFPNLYLMLAAGDTFAFTTVSFLKYVGNWSRVGILTNAGNPSDLSTALVIQHTALENGIAIPYFDSAMDMTDEIMMSLKASDIRIIVAYVSISRLVWKLICQTHKFGLTGSKYLFILNAVAYSDPTKWAEAQFAEFGCNNSDVVQQYASIVWIGPITHNGNSVRKAELGFSQQELDNLLQPYLNYTKTADYETRILCQDVVSRGLFALDASEKVLQRRNLTLRDYETAPGLISKVINDTILTLNYSSWRMGLMHYNRYGQMDGDCLEASYWTLSGGLQQIYRTRHVAGTDNRIFQNYFTIPLQHFHWAAWNGKVPRDQALVKKLVSEVNHEAFTAILSISVTLMAIQLIALSVTCRRKPICGYPFPRSKAVGLFGCIVLDAAALTLASSTSQNPYPISIFRIVLLSIGLELIVDILVLRVVTLAAEMRNLVRRILPTSITEQLQFGANPYQFAMATLTQMPLTSLTLSTSTYLTTMPGTLRGTVITPDQRPIDRVQLPAEMVTEADKLTVGGAISLTVVKAFILSIWLFCDPLRCFLSIVAKESFYHADIDTYTEVFVMACQSLNYYLVWISAIVVVHVAALGIAIFCLYQISRNAKFIDCPEHPAIIAFAVNNAIILILATALVFVVVNNAVGRQLILAAACLLMSMFTSFTLFFPMLQKIHQRHFSRSQVVPTVLTRG